jgi:hypothetical protein
MALIDPQSGQDDDTDCGDYDTPSGNIWCPDGEPRTAGARPGIRPTAGYTGALN